MSEDTPEITKGCTQSDINKCPTREGGGMDFDINKLTLQLMVSTTKYKKYLAKQDPNLLAELEQRGIALGKYKSRITNLARDLITYVGNDTEDRVAPADSTTELVDIMTRFIDVALAHIKTLDETKIDESGRDLNETRNISEFDNDTGETETQPMMKTKSAWGPTLHRYGYYPKSK